MGWRLNSFEGVSMNSFVDLYVEEAVGPAVEKFDGSSDDSLDDDFDFELVGCSNERSDRISDDIFDGLPVGDGFSMNSFVDLSNEEVDGPAVGKFDGSSDGSLEGDFDFELVGCSDGRLDGKSDGIIEGLPVGVYDDSDEGLLEGVFDGCDVGFDVRTSSKQPVTIKEYLLVGLERLEALTEIRYFEPWFVLKRTLSELFLLSASFKPFG